ncbi:MAG: VWA domain-containing protein, partial [Actinomycetota bacterium]|nr:VWA domain-containing protein [Actinomycetota bacterium]
MSYRVAALLAAVAVALLPAVAAAAEPGSLQINTVDADDYPTVSVTVSAPRQMTSRALPPEAFTLTEQGRPRDVTVSRLPGELLEVVLVMDTSGSMEGAPLAAAKAAASDFVLRLPQGVHVAVIAFNQTARVVSPFATDPIALTHAIQGLQAGGDTALYDAVGAAFGQLPIAKDAQRTVVLLSDGRNTSGATTLETATRTLRDAGAGFYVIGLDSRDTDPAALAQLAGATGGQVVPASDPAALAGVYQRIASEVSNQYRLTYRSRAHGPAAIQVEVAQDGLRAVGVREVVLPDTPYSLLDPAALGGRYGLIVGASAMYVALTLTILLLLAPRQPRTRLAGAARPAAPGERPRIGRLSDLADWASDFAERGLQRRGWRNALDAALEQAGVN